MKLKILFLSAAILFCANIALAMSDQTELAIGRGVDAKLKKKYGVFENGQIQKYIEHVGLKLVNVSDRQDIVYHFTVLNTDAINTTVAPGGYIYVTKGLLTKIKNEAELAAALSHEIIHVALRHGTEEIEEDMRFDTAMGRKSDAIWRGINTAYYFVQLGFGKRLETEADIKGTECLLRADYDPQAMVKLFDIIQVEEKQNRRSVMAFVRSHRKTTKRIDRVKLMQYNLRAEDQNKYDSVAGNYYPERYKENVLDVINK